MPNKSIDYKHSAEPFKSASCVVCQEKLETQWRYYCNICRAAVADIQRTASKAMREAGIDIESGARCADCGKPATCLDHRHYALPTEVDAVCTSCNRQRGPAEDVRYLAQAIMARKAGITLQDESKAPPAQFSQFHEAVSTAERTAILAALEKNRWNRTAAAKSLGITFRAIRYRIEKLGIDRVSTK